MTPVYVSELVKIESDLTGRELPKGWLIVCVIFLFDATGSHSPGCLYRGCGLVGQHFPTSWNALPALVVVVVVIN